VCVCVCVRAHININEYHILSFISVKHNNIPMNGNKAQYMILIHNRMHSIKINEYVLLLIIIIRKIIMIK
jgi:hypothetical protein